MRSRKPTHEEVAAVARRRLELLSAELAGLRAGPSDAPDPVVPDGPGELRATGEPTDQPAGAVPCPTRPGRHAHRPAGRTGVTDWVLDRLPATVQGRVQLGASHLAVVAVVVAAALAATTWWVVRAEARSEPVPLAARSVGASGSPQPLVTPADPSPPVAAPAGAVARPSAAASIVVDVAGKVRHPGIATLPAGSRVVDAIAAAGGARRGADLRALNLARVLSDGEQVVVGVPAPPGVAATAASAPVSGAPALVNINTAGQAELETLPGIGPVTAQAILEWRSDNGAFTAVDELLDVSGIGQATLAKIAPFVTL